MSLEPLTFSDEERWHLAVQLRSIAQAAVEALLLCADTPARPAQLTAELHRLEHFIPAFRGMLNRARRAKKGKT